MLRITKIDIKNFRGLYGPHEIKLGNPGKNLMVYGENGSGKSSLCQALKVFFESSTKTTDVSLHKNIFVQDGPNEDVYIKLTFNDNGTSTEYTLDRDNQKVNVQFIKEVNKIKGFLSYKDLLQTHYLHEEDVNLFGLLINNLFVNTPDPVSGTVSVFFRWMKLQLDIRENKNTVEYKNCPEILHGLNQSIKSLLDEVEVKANEIIQLFDYNVNMRFQFPGISIKEAAKKKDRDFDNKDIILHVDFFNKTAIGQHHMFLNEGRLTAIAISIYLASILIMPQQTPYKILLLDDILVGLDTSNRMPLLKILETYFQDYQIIMATYDRQWYEMVKCTLGERDWAYQEMLVKKEHQNGYEIPVVRSGNLIQIAKDYLAAGDMKASAVYIRTAFEQVVIKYCNDHSTPIKYRIRSEKIPIEDFWKALQACEKQQNPRQVAPALVKGIIAQRALVMNPFSHYDLTRPQFRPELQTTIDVVEQLKNALD